MEPYQSIDEYISLQPEELRPILTRVRETMRAAAPEAEEKISYGMPCFWQGKNLIYFGAMKGHLGIYPTGEGMRAFEEKLADYVTSKGAVQLPWDKPIPYELIAEMTRCRVKQVKEGTQ